jgi:TolA-binding protein
MVEALSDEARRQADADADGLPHPGAWHRLEARRSRPRHRLGFRATGFGLAAAGAASVALLVGVHHWRAGRALSYEVAGSAVVEQGYVRGGEAGSAVRFSDGTRIDLGAGARLSVVEPRTHGARLRVEEGTAHFAVNHLPHAAWTVEAGPYVVEVTGTVFDVRWSSADEVVEVRLHQGSVRVSGPLLAEHATLRPGQRLTARLATRELRIDENAGQAAPALTVPPPGLAPAPTVPADAAPPPTAPPPAAEKSPAGPTAEKAAPTPPAARPDDHPRVLRASKRAIALAAPAPAPWAPESWASRVAAGDANGVVDEAVAHGIDDTVATADEPTLVALADAARYAGRTFLAEQALRAQRKRFPGSRAARTAAFFLGRLADDRGAATEGLDWYRRYLTDEPNGPYAAEALGREMIGVARESGRQAARPLALEYLRRFPEGSYLLNARSILQGP